MVKKYFFLLGLVLGNLVLNAQRLDSFPESPSEFSAQIGDFMTASKQKDMEDLFKEFDQIIKNGWFGQEEFLQIRQTANLMLANRMTANPHFRDYLRVLLDIKKEEKGEQRFRNFHQILIIMLEDKEHQRVASIHEFIQFASHFFGNKTLRYSPSGTTWFAVAEDFTMDYQDHAPVVSFDKLDLLASWKEDSIFIYETSGKFFPVEQVWKGKGGRVTWERFDWDKETYVDLPEYEFEMTKSLYEVKGARLHYPLFFGNQVISGTFSDKLVVSNTATEGSYPRFESDEDYLKIDNIGKGIQFSGGFRLHGTTIYGFGTHEHKAAIRILDEEERLVYKGRADQFTIRKGERVVGERVESVFYFDQDSIYHPSVNVRFEIPTRELQLARGDRGSDRNPFFSSYHQVNIDVEKIQAFLDRDSVIFGRETIQYARKGDVLFESMKYFNKGDYQRLQNIAPYNPIAIMKVTAEREGNNFIDANLLASRINSKFTVDNIQTLLYDLVAQGFINYDSEKKLVEVKDKVFHYADADQNKVDFDFMRIRSETDSANAVLNLKNKMIQIEGVRQMELSRRQKVALSADSSTLLLKNNRNMDFSGKVYAGLSTLEGKDFHFDYDKFQILLDTIRFFDLFIPTGEIDADGNPVAYKMTSRIENLNGVLLIDAPANKSGREDIPIFPSLQTEGNSFVFYQYKTTQDSIYDRDSFYFELSNFSFNHLDAFSPGDIKFSGKMVSSEIFPEFEETLRLQDDYSLGFTTKTPQEGYPAYLGKGQYNGEIHLSNKGLLGKGNLRYLRASVDAEDFVFKPQQVTATAEEFNLAEDRASQIQIPQVKGLDVRIDWRPFQDSMYVRPEKVPFALYQSNDHTFDGTLILTPGGVKGDGLLDWKKAGMRSRTFSFGAFSAVADTTDIRIKALDGSNAIAIQTTNVNGEVDFDRQTGTFVANDAFLETTLPYNQYQTSMNEFDWDMKGETITFKAKETDLGSFVSIHPDQDSLTFQGQTAFYDLKSNELKIGGVPFVVSADAFIYPDEGKIDIQPGGVMSTLENARITADTSSQYHVINRATVNVLGRKEYRASGFYEYNVGDRQQEIELTNISGTRVGKGAISQKQVATRATGEITPENHFYIDHKTEFQGTISLRSESKNLQFDGFARLDAGQLPQRNWFSVSSEGDKKDLAIRFDTPMSTEGERLYTGLYLSKETARIYPRVMMPLYFRKDRPILPVTGVFKYNKAADEFVFGDSSRVLLNQVRGNQLIFRNKTGEMEADGKFSLLSGLKYVKVDAAGRAKTAFPAEVVADTMAEIAPEIPLEVDLMAGIQIILPDKLLKVMLTDIQSSTFDSRIITYLTELDFYKKSATNLFPEGNEMEEAIAAISSGFLDIPKKYNPYTFVFSKLPMKWDPDYQSFVSRTKQLGVVSIGGESINKMLEAYVEFKMPTNEDDRLYVYIKSPSELFYFFGYKQGILSVTSNNTKFMEELTGMKKTELVMKMPDGETYEIQPVDVGDGTRFVRRVQAVN